MNLSFLKDKTVLVTGAAGYIAARLTPYLAGAAGRILRLDRPGSAFPPTDGPALIKDIEADIREGDLWNDLVQDADFIFHFAAQTSVYAAEEDPSADLGINFLPMTYLLAACRRQQRRPIILFAGTVTQVGITTTVPVNEDHPDRPITVYDLHKLLAEQYLQYHTRQGQVRGAVLRLANVYGPGPRSGSADRGILNAMIRRALNGEPITVYGDGNFLRDYIYIDDVARAFLAAAAHIEDIAGRYFVLGSGQGHTFAAAMDMIAARVHYHTGREATVVSVPPPARLSPIEFRQFVADSGRFRSRTGWRPQWELQDGIDATIKDFLQKKD